MKPERHKWWVLAGSTLLYLATVADGPNFNAAIPSIQSYFSASIAQIQWLTSIAAMFVAAFVLAAGAFGDLYGRKRVFIIGGMGLMVSLVLQALSPSVGFLTFMRGLDGLFSAITTPLAVALIMMEFEEKDRSMAMGVFTGAVASGEIISPLISGRLTDVIGWRASFITSIGAAMLAVLLVARFARESKDPQATTLDWGGVSLSAISLFGLVGGFILAGTRGFGNTLVQASIVLGVLGLLIFLWWENRTPHPALQLSLFRKPVFASAFAVGFLMFFAFMPVNPLMNAFFQNVRQDSAFIAGLAIIPYSLGTVLSSPFAGKITDKLGPRLAMVIGIATIVLGFLVLSTMSIASPYWIIGLGLLLVAVGYGVVNPPRVAVLMSSAPDEVAGAASGANSVGVEFGTATGIALSTTLAVGFGGRAFINLLNQAGLTAEQRQTAVDVLRSAMTDTLSTHNPAISQSALDQLLEGARIAFGSGIAQTMLLMAGIVLVAGVIAWFGMRSEADQLAERAETKPGGQHLSDPG